MAPKRKSHAAVDYVLRANLDEAAKELEGPRSADRCGTSPSLVRALAIGCLSRLDPSRASVNIWDPAVGSGLTASILKAALGEAGVAVSIRGQDINEDAAKLAEARLGSSAAVKVECRDSLIDDAFPDYLADLVVVDGPFSMAWRQNMGAVEARAEEGSFHFGLPQTNDSIWLFISLALEKLRSPEEGGGRVAALVTPAALSSGGATGEVRNRIVDSGLLESVTRLPDGLAPGTGIGLYLLTFSNSASATARRSSMVFDLQTAFDRTGTTRTVPISAFEELESGLRLWKPGPRNRLVASKEFKRRTAQLYRAVDERVELSWSVDLFGSSDIGPNFLKERYGERSDISIKSISNETADLNPARFFDQDSKRLSEDIDTLGWDVGRLSSFLMSPPRVVKPGLEESEIYISTSHPRLAVRDYSEIDGVGRVLGIRLDSSSLRSDFLVSWLNSSQGSASLQRSIDQASAGSIFQALRSDTRSLMRWADELLIPVPSLDIQRRLAEMDEQLVSYQAELDVQRENIWTSIDDVHEFIEKMEQVSDQSLTRWLDELPFPLASAIWTAQTSPTSEAQQRSYLHAWEAFIAFHAIVLLSAVRGDRGFRAEIETEIRNVLFGQNLSIERASLGTWSIIFDKTSKELRRFLSEGNEDDVARVRRLFSGLPLVYIEKLISSDLSRKFKEVIEKRNRWSGHGGYTSQGEFGRQVESLVSDLRQLRSILGGVWRNLYLVRSGVGKRVGKGYSQSVEIAVGARSPFVRKEIEVGELMEFEHLYLVRAGADSPMKLANFLQLRSAAEDARFTSYFYNRREASGVRLVSYQYGPESEIFDDATEFRDDFGALTVDGLLDDDSS